MKYTISQLKKNEFQGVDVNLEISLFEYGISWKEKEKDNYEFIYGINSKDNNYYLFNNAFMNKKEFIELINEQWFKIQDVCSYMGITEKELINDFPHCMNSVISYHGVENIFGTINDYFKIKKM